MSTPFEVLWRRPSPSALRSRSEIATAVESLLATIASHLRCSVTLETPMEQIVDSAQATLLSFWFCTPRGDLGLHWRGVVEASDFPQGGAMAYSITVFPFAGDDRLSTADATRVARFFSFRLDGDKEVWTDHGWITDEYGEWANELG